MEKKYMGKIGAFAVTFLGFWLIMRYLFPIILPFLIGFGIAAVSAPGIRFLQERLHIPRTAACVLAVTLELILIAGLLGLLCALGYRELTALAGGIPEAARQLTDGIGQMRQWLLDLVRRLPAGMSGALERMVTELFAGGSVLVERLTSGMMGVIGMLLGGLPGGAMLLGTAVLSGYMIAAQLPAIQRRLAAGSFWRGRVEPVLEGLRSTVGCWLRAQVKLAGITFGIVWAGLALLGTGKSLLWALGIALVDAVPMLGTGTILLPWAAILLLRGQTVRAVGLAGIYVTAMLVRSAVEPKLLGKHLGMNPLLTLAALYAGYRLWGVMGMLLSPILAVTANQLAALRNGDLNC